MSSSGRWRFISTIKNKSNNETLHIYVKFIEIPSINGYEFQVTDLNGNFWTERLDTISLQERLKVQASGMEIDSVDLIKLLEQMCESFDASALAPANEQIIEFSEDFKRIEIRGSVKIGFIRLKWAFKPEKADDISVYSKMIREDFLLPLFASLGPDKEIRNFVTESDLDTFYKLVPNLIRKTPQEYFNTEPQSTKQVMGSIEEESKIDPIQTQTLAQTQVSTAEEIEQAKRRELEEQLSMSKKKKKKLF